MKKKIMALVLMLAVLCLPCQSAWAAMSDEDTIVDKTSDWFATLGKSGQEKDQIIFERKRNF